MNVFLYWFVAVLATEAIHAQYARRIGSPSFAQPSLDPAVKGAYYYGSGQLFVLMETDPFGSSGTSNEEAWAFVNSTNGQIQGTLRLDPNHGALSSPDGREILIAGARSTNNQPVYFAGRYAAGSLQPIALRQLDVNASDGYTLKGEVSPDGGFIFHGQHNSQGNVIGKYGTNFVLRWASTLTYRGQLQPFNLEVYPQPSGDVGFRMLFQRIGSGGVAFQTNVVGMLDGTNGMIKWSGNYSVVRAETVFEDDRFIFGTDGSLFLSNKEVGRSVTNTVLVSRVRSNGTLAYSKSLTLPGAIHEHQYYFGGHALIYFRIRDGGVDRTQFVVLDENGNLAANVALNCQLLHPNWEPPNEIKLTAARREGTDLAFLRLDCGIAGGHEQTLARLNLTNGQMDLRRLPLATVFGDTYEVVTTPKRDPLSPHHNLRGMSAITTVIIGFTSHHQGTAVTFHGIPGNGDFPTCLPLSVSSVTLAAPLIPQIEDLGKFNLSDGAAVSSRAMPGMTTPLAGPIIRGIPVKEVACEDNAPIPTLAIADGLFGTSISWAPETLGFVLRESSTLSPPNWMDSPYGGANPVTVSGTESARFYQLYKP